MWALQSTAPHTGVDRPLGAAVHDTAPQKGREGDAEPEPHRLYTSASPEVQRQGVVPAHGQTMPESACTVLGAEEAAQADKREGWRET